MKVSFIMPAYKVKFLRDAIESILNQRYVDFDLVIVDDASPENLKAVVDEFNDSRISYIRNDKNIGGESLVRQWNHCLQYVSGEYCVLAADDDLYDPEFLSVCIGLAKKYPQVDIIRSSVKQIDEENNVIGLDNIILEYCSKIQFVYYWFQGTILTCIGNFMFKSSTLKNKKFIDFPFAFGSDTASTIAMAEHGIANTNNLLFKFRISTIHLSSDKGKLKEKLQANSLLYSWLKEQEYAAPKDEIDQFCLQKIQWSSLYSKCKYDYYNLAIKFLPLHQLGMIKECTLLTKRDRFIMFLRYLVDRIIK